MGKKIEFDEFRESIRAAVLKALDDVSREATGEPNFLGATDQELPALFRGIDAQARCMAERINDAPTKIIMEE